MYKKIKNWINMYPPKYAELKEWNKIDKENKIKYPIRYWITNTFIPNTWWKITIKYNNISSYIRFGIFEKHHLIDTKLKKGFQEVDTRILYGMFSLLVDFVEVEKAWMEAVFNKNYKRPWWKLNRRFRSRELGIKYLDWEITLIGSNNNSQGKHAKIIKDLYIWWVDIRPKRKDPYDTMTNWTTKSKKERSLIFKNIDKIENDWFNEDSEMLKKLIEVRGSLWT